MKLTVNVPTKIELNDEDLEEATKEYIRRVYNMNEDYILDEGYIKEQGTPNGHNGDWDWENVRKATAKDKEYFSVLKKIEERSIL